VDYAGGRVTNAVPRSSLQPRHPASTIVINEWLALNAGQAVWLIPWTAISRTVRALQSNPTAVISSGAI